MARRHHEQYCALARTLDVAGDRWTLLIVRELTPGSRRFTDLLDGLPGVSRNLLTERLRALECGGIIARQELPPPAARQVYELTDDGRDLAVAMAPLIAWGARRIGDRKPGESFRARWPAVAMVGLADREAARGVNETYEYLVGDSAFHFTVDDGSIELHDGRAGDPAVTLTTDEGTWADIAAGKITASSAAAAGALTVAGDAEAATRLRKIFAREPMLAQARATIDRVWPRYARVGVPGDGRRLQPMSTADSLPLVATVIPLDDLRRSPTAALFQGRDDVPVSIFVTEYERGQGPALHLHPYPEVFVVQTGTAAFTARDEELVVTKGHIVTVPAETPHGFKGAGEDTLRVVSVHPSGTVEQTNL